MKWSIPLVLSGFLFFSSCTEETPPLPQAVTCDKSALLDFNEFENSPDDPFLLDSVWIVSNCLFVSYTYGGGCGETEMKLIGYHEDLGQLPSSVHSRFSFLDKDLCKVSVAKTESFDLTPFQKRDYPQIIVRIDGWDQPILYSY